MALGVLGIAAGWWAAREGDPVDSALGLTLPAGTRLIHSEHGHGVAADGSSADYHAVYLAATRPADALYEQLEARPDLEPFGIRRLRRGDGAIITVAPAREVPATRTLPVRPVAGQIPLGTRSWVVIWHGPLPPSTAHLAMPPYGES